jgi:hypothetical protein
MSYDDRIALPSANSIRDLKGQTKIRLLPSAQSIADSQRSAWETECRDRMDEADVGCIITNVHRHSDQMAHWVNAQRSHSTARDDVVSRHISFSGAAERAVPGAISSRTGRSSDGFQSP